MTCAHGFIGACAVCDGCGQIPEPDICPTCHDAGYLFTDERGRDLDIPKQCPNPECSQWSNRPVRVTR